MNALTGAAIGAGTKLLIDKITGKPTVTKPPAEVASAAVKNAAAKALNANPAGAKSPAKKIPPITSKVLTDEEIQAELDRAKASEETGAPPEGAIDNGDGTYSVFEDGMVTTYDANGAVVGMGADTATNPAEVE